jgi:predicted TIM-barrel fold metal-dependent hydrolase
MARDADDFLAHMDSRWRQEFEARGIRFHARARDRYNHPEKTYRADSALESGDPAGSDPKVTIAQMLDPHGITCALLLPQQIYGVTAWGDTSAAYAFEAANNDYFRETWLGADQRFTLALTVSPHDPHAAAAEIRRCGGDPGILGVQLLLMDRMLGDRSFDPIYEAACELDLPIVVHQSGSEGCYTSSQTVAGGAPRSYGERHVVLTQVGVANVVDLIVGGAFERFPQLRVLMVEWGFSWLQALMDRMDFWWDRDPGAAPLVKKRPSEYVLEHITFSTQPLDEPDTGQAAEVLFADPRLDELILFSSDYPHYDADDPTFVLRSKVPGRLRDAICFENARRVFGDVALGPVPVAR